MNKTLLILMLMAGAVFASVCPANITPICGTDNVNYVNESVMALPIVPIYCGSCAQYQSYQQGYNLYGNYSSSQLNNTNSSYMVRFLSSSFGAIIGNDPFGLDLEAIGVLGFFFVWVSMSNMRVESKAAIIVPAFVLASVFAGWLLAVMALGVGIIIFLGLSRLFNR